MKSTGCKRILGSVLSSDFVPAPSSLPALSSCLHCLYQDSDDALPLDFQCLILFYQDFTPESDLVVSLVY